MPIHVLVADDQQLIRQGIATLLDLESDISVVGQAENGETTVTLTQQHQPDLVLMDIQMPGMDGIEALTQIRTLLPTCKVLMLTTFSNDHYIIQSMKAGACGYLLKDIPSADLAQAVRLAHAGIYQLDPNVAGKLVGNLFAEKDRASETAVSEPDIPVTPRELDVLRMLSSGASNREIAEKLIISEGTVKKHISNILNTLDLRDRTQAAIYAVQHGIT
ncbi:MAG: response regulator transcription factor [Chloroflexota bacterium]